MGGRGEDLLVVYNDIFDYAYAYAWAVTRVLFLCRKKGEGRCGIHGTPRAVTGHHSYTYLHVSPSHQRRRKPSGTEMVFRLYCPVVAISYVYIRFIYSIFLDPELWGLRVHVLLLISLSRGVLGCVVEQMYSYIK